MATGATDISASRTKVDWRRVVKTVLVSRRMDDVEETKLYKEGKVLYQFSARGHELGQVLLGMRLDHSNDGVGAYYRSRPLLLTLGLGVEDAFAGPLGKSGAYSNGRDIGVVCNLPGEGGATVLPMAGDVGSQFTPVAGWAQAVRYRANTLKDAAYEGAIGVVLGGEGAVATNGFWSSLTIATTLKLPMLFVVEDNGYAISVPGDKQTPGANIAKNLGAFRNLLVRDGDGTDPDIVLAHIDDVVSHVRSGRGPALVRFTVPRLSGHSGQDTQAYKPKTLLERERADDPLASLRAYVADRGIDDAAWADIEAEVEAEVDGALARALARPEPDPAEAGRFVYAETDASGTPLLQRQGGVAPEGHVFPAPTETPDPEPTRVNMVTAIRRTLEAELTSNPKLLVFGEDVGPKGGVHAATMGLTDAFGEDRVFDTSLSEEGIIGRAVGMAACGLVPVAEIQFRKYADPATEQLNNCGTIRWRTANRFAAPIIVRLPGGFFKCGDPWHSVSSEVTWAHGIGWQVCMPSNAQDAVGLLRAAMRSNNPTIFFEQRHLLDAAWARRPYPGDDFVVPIGTAARLREGDALTVVTWGAMVERCEQALDAIGAAADLLDLRTIAPWDKEAVFASVRKTRRCIVVHEDNGTAGFGAEIVAALAADAFWSLDAPVKRVTTPDVPIPYNVGLMNALIPSVKRIEADMRELLAI